VTKGCRAEPRQAREGLIGDPAADRWRQDAKGRLDGVGAARRGADVAAGAVTLAASAGTLDEDGDGVAAHSGADPGTEHRS
jgi:hypothetical protein